MNGTKHTPGPWKITPIDESDKWIEIAAPGARIDYDDVDPKEARANARLIAAAPNLLAALENAPKPTPEQRILANGTNYAPFADAYITWYDGPRAAALAKARGKP